MNLKNKIILSLLLIAFYQNIYSQLVINEISICNVSKQLDPNFDYSGWIELYNSSDKEIDLKNVYFSDDKSDLLKYKLAISRKILPKNYQIVWLNSEIINSKTKYSLDMDADGGELYISDNKGNLYDYMNYKEQYMNISYGRAINGDTTSELVHFIEDSFCKDNNESEIGYEMSPNVIFSIPSGFYNEKLSLEMTYEGNNSLIYYTLDSSEPSKNSLLYTDKIEIDSTTVVKARAYKDNCFDGYISTNTYMINERKPEKLPYVFLSTSYDNLYHDSLGIYCIGTNGKILTSQNPKANYNQDWTRLANFELIDNEREIYLNQSVGISISGNASRGYDQKSFKIKARNKFGNKRFDINIFPDREGLRYKSFLLRAGGQYHNAVQLIHDALIQSFADITGIDYQASKMTVVYLNGKYWGIYNFRERKNKDYIYSHYGLDETDINIVEYAWRAVAGVGTLDKWKEFESFVVNNDISDNNIFDEICNQMNIDSYLYYMAFQILAKNSDWPNNNQQIFRSLKDRGKWTWTLQDMDKCFENSTSKNILKNLAESESSLLSTKLIVHLLKNEKFKNDYITIQSIVAGAVLEPDRFKDRMETMKNLISEEYPFYQERWPEQGKSNLEKATASTIKNQSLACSQIFDHLKENFNLENIVKLNIFSNLENTTLNFNDKKLPIFPYKGKWFEGKELKLSVPLYSSNKKFKEWIITEGNKEYKIQSTSLTIKLNTDADINIIYEKDDWVCRSGLYINEVSADNDVYVDNMYKYEDWIELYNSSSKPISLSGLYISNNELNPKLFRFSETDNEELTINPYDYKIIWCSKKPDRGLLHTNFKLSKNGGTVILSESNNEETKIINSFKYSSHDGNISEGRYPDGNNDIFKFEKASFNSSNLSSYYDQYSYSDQYELVSEIKQNNTDNNIIIQRLNETILKIITEENSLLKIVSVSGKICHSEMIKNKETFINTESFQERLYLIIIETDSERFVYKYIK